MRECWYQRNGSETLARYEYDEPMKTYGSCGNGLSEACLLDQAKNEVWKRAVGVGE